MQLDLTPTDRTDDLVEYAVSVDAQKIGKMRVYLATKEESKSMSKYLKKKVKEGQPFSAKIFVETDLDNEILGELSLLIEERIPEIKGKVYLLRKEGQKLSPLELRSIKNES